MIGGLPKAVPRHPITSKVGEVSRPFIGQRAVAVAGERVGVREKLLKHSHTSKGEGVEKREPLKMTRLCGAENERAADLLKQVYAWPHN